MPQPIEGLEAYEIQEQIGRGGFATVYRANDVAHGRSVAIKVINGTLSADEQRRFDRERLAIGQLASHPNVVPVFASGVTEGGQAYLVLEYASGGSIGNRVESKGPLPWSEAVDVMAGVARAVEASHAVGIRHRDIKPDNILLSQYGEPKLSDFGIASLASGATTASAATMTVSHSPPEMLQGVEITDAADVYSMASTFHHLVTGSPPFSRDTDGNVAAIITRVLTADAPDLTSVGVPSAVSEVIDAAMVKDPSKRTQSATAFRSSLLAAAGKRDEPVVVASADSKQESTTVVDRAALGLEVTTDPDVVPAPPRRPDKQDRAADEGREQPPPAQHTMAVDPVLPLAAVSKPPEAPEWAGDTGPNAFDHGQTPDGLPLAPPPSAHLPPVRHSSPSMPLAAGMGAATGEQPPVQKKRRWPVVLIVALCLLLGSGGLGALILGNRDQDGEVASSTTIDTAAADAAGTSSSTTQPETTTTIESTTSSPTESTAAESGSTPSPSETPDGVRGATGPYDREANIETFMGVGLDRETAECVLDALEEQLGEEALAPGVQMTPQEEVIAQSVIFDCSLSL